ncbi:hypothetical protein [Phycisphaera mikurensis]|uniref:PEP-CTERM protein-sorting domain-containing protein n=1 Tax=Phycisphaera mikurensis (strain NBRC 102666 / KCTC 22515 / FYK2301M01) TaxID=1142394 RepID=I0IHC3_PHYMF|nr:hypothetical protein [Phycisphaera mikurensis]MBB6440910.1 MYXO-CTERM domain-containing protein [Phycisphaera mikurensis]BAM04661.1 hypothetical protein PSMK_25020 [Phycisphaera mikurensis NBRC 102666]
MPRPAPALLAALALPAVAGLPAAAATIDFDDIEAGSSLSDLGGGVTVTAFNASDDAPGSAVAYDFDGHPELAYGGQQAPFDGGGNVAAGTDLGNGIAIQGPDAFRILEFRRPAGHLRFDFAEPIGAFGFTVVDVEGPSEFTTDTGYFVAAFSGGEEVLRVDFADLVTPGSAHFDPSVAFGNNTANRIAAFSAELAGAASFDSAIVALGGSGVVDEVVTTEAAVVPTPAAAGAGLVVLAGLAARRRRA